MKAPSQANGETSQGNSSAPSVTITAPDGRVKTVLPSRRQQRLTVRLIAAVLLIELLLCLGMIALEAVGLTVRWQYRSPSSPADLYYVRTCRIGAGLWAGATGLCCVAVGAALMLTRTGHCGRRVCQSPVWKTAYGCCAVFAAVVDIVLVVSLSVCIFGLARAWRAAQRRTRSRVDANAAAALSKLKTMVALDACLVAIAVLHLLVTVASIKILRRGWLDGKYSVNTQEPETRRKEETEMTDPPSSKEPVV